jgi:Zn-dependent protease with chaperone function
VTAESYQRIRLWSGIFSIGLHFTMVWGLYLSSSWWTPLLQKMCGTLFGTGALALVLTCGGLAFDILSGHAIEIAARRTQQSFADWFRDWRTGAIRYFFALWTGLYLFSCTYAKPLANLGLIASLLFFALLLLAWLLMWWIPRGWLVRDASLNAYAERVQEQLTLLHIPMVPIGWVKDVDRESVNGSISPLGKPELWLSSNIASFLTPRQTALLAARELWFYHSGTKILILIICLIWILLGLAGTALMPSSHPLQSAIGGSAFMTTWCLFALFVWPSLNQHWSHKADAYLLQYAKPDELLSLFETLQRLNQTDTELSTAKTTIFHPIPPLEQRLNSLR